MPEEKDITTEETPDGKTSSKKLTIALSIAAAIVVIIAAIVGFSIISSNEAVDEVDPSNTEYYDNVGKDEEGTTLEIRASVSPEANTDDIEALCMELSTADGADVAFVVTRQEAQAQEAGYGTVSEAEEADASFDEGVTGYISVWCSDASKKDGIVDAIVKNERYKQLSSNPDDLRAAITITEAA